LGTGKKIRIIVLRTISGQEIYRKELTSVSLAPGEEQDSMEPFVFKPVAPGRYILEYAYSDETRGAEFYFREVQRLRYGSNVRVETDKPAYDYGDTALTSVIINGAGLYQVTFDCPRAVAHEIVLMAWNKILFQEIKIL
jgi:hypothetical protein